MNLIPRTGSGPVEAAYNTISSLPAHFPGALSAIAEEKLDVAGPAEASRGGLWPGGLWPPCMALLVRPPWALASFQAGDHSNVSSPVMGQGCMGIYGLI